MCEKYKNDIVLKTAGSDDAANIAGVEKECLNVAWSENQIRESLESENYRFFIALDNDVAVGSGGIRFLPPEAEITNIAVKKEYRRKGVASKILGSLLDEAFSRGCESAFLEVAKSNVPAVRLYENFGFDPIYIRKNYYKDPPDDAVIMKKILINTEKR